MSSGDSKKQRKPFYKSDNGWSSRGSGGGGGRGGGGRGGRGGNGSAGGPSRMGEHGRMSNPMGIYRETPALQAMSMPGILVTTIKNKERAAEKDMIELLERVADELYPETAASSSKAAGGDGGEMSIEDELQAELKQMQGGGGKSTRFRLCQHDIQCVIYIGVLAPLDPRELVYSIMAQVELSGKSPLKFVSRLVPLTAIGPATFHQLGETAKLVVEEGFASSTEPKASYTFAVQTAARNSDRLERLPWIQRTAEIVGQLGAGHTVDLKNAERTIIIEVQKNSMAMSVVRDYDRYKRFNPGALAEAQAKRQVEEEEEEAGMNVAFGGGEGEVDAEGEGEGEGGVGNGQEEGEEGEGGGGGGGGGEEAAMNAQEAQLAEEAAEKGQEGEETLQSTSSKRKLDQTNPPEPATIGTASSDAEGQNGTTGPEGRECKTARVE